MRKAQSIYSELAVAKESGSIPCIWQKLKGRQRSGEGLQGKQASGIGGARQEAAAWGSLRRANRSRVSCTLG